MNRMTSHDCLLIGCLLAGNLLYGSFLGPRSSIAQGNAVQETSHQVRLTPPLRRSSGDRNESMRWYSDALTTLAGTIQRFDANQLSIIVSGDAVPARYAAERVLEIKLTNVPDDQRTAFKAFTDGRFTEAVKGFVGSVSKTVSSERPPVWRQQWLSMMAAQAAFRSGRGEIALEIVQQLDGRPFPPMTLGILPIDWTGHYGRDQTSDNRAVQESLVAVAAKRASSESLAVKLVAASWLLGSSKYRGAASAAIDRIANQSQRPWIAALAAQLQWRSKLPPAIKSNWRDWEKEIQAMPMTLQPGPLVSLAHHVERVGLEDATRKLKLALEFAAPTWHPDLPN